MFTFPQFSYKLEPSPEDLFKRGLSAHQAGDLNTAKSLYSQVLKRRPEHVDALHFLGVVEGALGSAELAIECIQRAIELDPTNAACHLHLGNVYKGLDQPSLAVAAYLRAIELRPGYHMAYSNLGATYDQMGEFDKAIESYDQALSLVPNYPEAQWNRAALALLLGDYPKGWQLFESRWAVKAHQMEQRVLAGVRWTGREYIANKRILIFAEQGLGDTIQFSRYALLLQKLGAIVVLQVPSALKKILQTLSDSLSVIDDSETPSSYDYYCPIASLPLMFGTTLQTIPSFTSYLHATQEDTQAWGRRLPSIKQKRVGLVWSGNPQHLNDRNRSIALGDLLPRLPSNCQYVCLQKEVSASDKELLAKYPDFSLVGSLLQDFADTAAICANLDVVVTVDTSVAHLAGAMGVPTKLLIPFVPDWRWLLKRDDSPWYPSIQLYRQKKLGDWSHAFNELASDLRRLSE